MEKPFLQKYGAIKYTIQQLDQQVDKLRNQIDELQIKKQDLDGHNQKMLLVLAYSDPVVKFLHGSDHSCIRRIHLKAMN